jgi:hypothetical protein
MVLLKRNLEGAFRVHSYVAACTTIRYSLTGNIAKRLTQAKNFSNSPSGTTFWAQGVARTDSVATC